MVGADERVRRLRRRHLQPRLQALRSRAPDRRADLGRRRRHLAAPRPRRRHGHDAAGVLRWFVDVGFGVENYGTDPDIEVEIKPQDHAAGHDPQMERALAEIQKILRRTKIPRPDFEDRPDLRPPALPGS